MVNRASQITLIVPAGLKVFVRITAAGLEIIVQELGSDISDRLRAVRRELARCVGALVNAKPARGHLLVTSPVRA